MVEEFISVSQVRRSFSGATSHYDTHAELQREIGRRLLGHLNFTKIEPKAILDIGCGTGFFTRLLAEKYKKSNIYAVDLSEPMVKHTKAHHERRWPWQGKHHHAACDAIALPFQDASFDLVTSNLAMQWVPDVERMMKEMRRVLKPGGLILFSTFGRRTLIELKQTLASINAERTNSVLSFPDVMSLGNSLSTVAVEMPVTDADLFTLTYPDTMSLVRELKGIGASASAIQGRSGGLYGRALLRNLDTHYKANYMDDDQRIYATFEALYAQAWYKPASFADRENVIPIQLI
ncbi:MAG: malonyl-[acyl-carrier protein] O-methyltransferase BioC [Zetaproteobacteria bacterium CG2_30_46_52]|nr:MAG: malonyl-[acyl-carrier protein] O-methyltransferase BioC [Zetaproteobacteria bacterium CG2_30_46_52]